MKRSGKKKKHKGPEGFYEAMGFIFRPGFGSDSKVADRIVDGIKGLFFEEREE